MTGIFPLHVVPIDSISSARDLFTCLHLCQGKTILSAGACAARQIHIPQKWEGHDLSPCRNGCKDGKRVAAKIPGFVPQKQGVRHLAASRKKELPPCPYCTTRLVNGPRRLTCGAGSCLAKAGATRYVKCEKCRLPCLRSPCQRPSCRILKRYAPPPPRKVLKNHCEKCSKFCKARFCISCLKPRDAKALAIREARAISEKCTACKLPLGMTAKINAALCARKECRDARDNLANKIRRRAKRVAARRAA